MNITLVKKIMEDGEECRKCREVSERLSSGDELRFIDNILYADVRNPESEGNKVAGKHNIDIAPFFVVEEDGHETVYKSYMVFKKKVLNKIAEETGQVQGLPSESLSHGDPDIDKLNEKFESKAPQELLEWALKEFRPKIALAWSGAEDVAVLDMMVRIDPGARFFTLDTGRLNPETYDLIDRVREKYGIDIEVLFPDSEKVEDMVGEKGVNLFYESIENRKLCCNVRKVQPMKRMLSTLDAWITGLRRDQAVTRNVLKKVESDDSFGGIIKLNPLANWTNDDVWDYIRSNDVPHNELHDKGYPSIGCAPCTRAVKSREDIRAGRWWWESPDNKECGIHVKSK